MIIKTLEEAIEVLKDLRSEMEDARDRIAVNAINMVLEAVKEPKRGTWTEEFDGNANPFFQRRWRCSVCNDYNYYGRPDFCPCCGADMRPKEGEAE